jgi:SAM-dependent methyltransferase
MDESGMPGSGAQASHNAAVWSTGEFLAAYDHGTVHPVEAILMARYREAIAGRVLDVGCGGGRLLRYLDLLGDDVHAIDISERMIAHCRSRFPKVDVHRGDLGDLGATEEGRFDAILIPDNTLDVFDDRERRKVLSDLCGLLAPGGLLVFNAHNLDHRNQVRHSRVGSVVHRGTGYLRGVARGQDGGRMRSALGPLQMIANRRRLRALQSRGPGYAINVDSAHNTALLHYYTGAVAQRRQLADCGFDVVEVLEMDGRTVPRDQAGESFWLYYVARPR